MNSNTNSNSFHVIYLLSNTWKSFWQRTDIAGVTNAREAQSSLRKKIWIVLSTVFFILTVSSLYQVLHEYTHYPVTTSITVKYQNQVTENYFKIFTFLVFYRLQLNVIWLEMGSFVYL